MYKCFWEYVPISTQILISEAQYPRHTPLPNLHCNSVIYATFNLHFPSYIVQIYLSALYGLILRGIRGDYKLTRHSPFYVIKLLTIFNTVVF